MRDETECSKCPFQLRLCFLTLSLRWEACIPSEPQTETESSWQQCCQVGSEGGKGIVRVADSWVELAP